MIDFTKPDPQLLTLEQLAIGFETKQLKGVSMQFVNGMIYGSGFTFAAILTVAAMKAIFHLGIC